MFGTEYRSVYLLYQFTQGQYGEGDFCGDDCVCGTGIGFQVCLRLAGGETRGGGAGGAGERGCRGRLGGSLNDFGVWDGPFLR